MTARGPEEEGKKAREERGEELATTVAKLLNATDRPVWICHFRGRGVATKVETKYIPS